MSFWSRWPLRKTVDGSQYTDTDGARQSRQAAEFVDGLPDDPNKPGYKASPIPTYAGTIGPVDRTRYTVKNVRTADLKTRQPFINADKVKNFDRSKLPNDSTRHPLVTVTRDGCLVVDNGNHRVSHMLAIGMKETPARIIHEIHGYGGQGEGSIP